MGRLVRIGAEQPSPLQAVLEGDVDRRTVRLEHIVPASPGRRVGRLAERAQQPSVPAEDPDVRCERVGLPWKRLLEDCFVIAVVSGRQTVPGLEDIDLELPPLVARKAMPVGKLSPEAKTLTTYPDGT